jgi:four helix bundle protein
MGTIKLHTELIVYQKSFQTSMEIFRLSNEFPKEEKFSLTDQIRRSSHSVCANISEAWGKRKYTKSFVAKLTDAEAEARETQTWLEFSESCQYILKEDFERLNDDYNQIIGMLITIMNQSEKWTSFEPNEK